MVRVSLLMAAVITAECVAGVAGVAGCMCPSNFPFCYDGWGGIGAMFRQPSQPSAAVVVVVQSTVDPVRVRIHSSANRVIPASAKAMRTTSVETCMPTVHTVQPEVCLSRICAVRLAKTQLDAARPRLLRLLRGSRLLLRPPPRRRRQTAARAPTAAPARAPCAWAVTAAAPREEARGARSAISRATVPSVQVGTAWTHFTDAC